ncbi:MAG: response regulator [Nitrospiraceae bacterium]|nr:response regulator [Nitrospiraceae bacterium]
MTRHSINEAAEGARPTILLADDNEVNRRVAARMVEQLGYRLDIVSNGREAFEAVFRGTYAAILMDCRMPEMDGLAATVAIRQRERPGRRIPIIALTAEGDREKCLEAGMDDYLAKPVKRQELQAVLLRWISREPTEESESGSLSQPEQVHVEESIDSSVLTELRQLADEEENLLGTLITLFLDQTAESLAGLRTMVQRANGPEIQRLAHKLNGSCSNLGVQRMRRMCMELQASGEAMDIRRIQALLVQLEDEFEKVKVRLDAERAVRERRAV